MDTDPDALSAAWLAAQDDLPDRWQLDGLRCASTGLTPEERSDDWVAVATRPDGAQQILQAADPFDALAGLVAMLHNEQEPGPRPLPVLDQAEADRFWVEAGERGRKEPSSEITILVPSRQPKG